MNYITRINELNMRLEKLKTELADVEREMRGLRRLYGNEVVNPLWFIVRYGECKVPKEIAEHYENLQNIRDDYEDEIHELEIKRFNLRNEYRSSVRGDYYRPVDEIDINDIIRINGSIIGFKL